MDRAGTCQTPLRGWSMSRTSQSPNGDFLTVTISKHLALAVGSSPLATKAISAPYTTWAIELPVVRWTSWWPTRLTTVTDVISISTSISPILPHPVAITPTV